MFYRILYIFILCVLIRTIKTVQNISQNSGYKSISVALILVDTTFFLLVFKDVLTNDLTVPIMLAVAFGYMVGYLLGSTIEEKIALGKAVVTIKIPKRKAKQLKDILQKNGFQFIQSKRHYSAKGKLKKVFQGVVYRKELPKLKAITKELPIIATVEQVKATFGRELVKAKDYLEIEGK